MHFRRRFEAVNSAVMEEAKFDGGQEIYDDLLETISLLYTIVVLLLGGSGSIAINRSHNQFRQLPGFPS